MAPGGLLQHSKYPAACPYSEPDKSSPCPPSNFIEAQFNITPHYLWIFKLVPSFKILHLRKCRLSSHFQPVVIKWKEACLTSVLSTEIQTNCVMRTNLFSDNRALLTQWLTQPHT
jgi:hypothetical protein